MQDIDHSILLAESDQKSSRSLLDHVGNTPLLPLRRVTEGLSDQIEIHVKAEWHNPSGSVKDRPAAEILRHAIANGDLDNDKLLLDSSSGNMGISYAMFAASLGVKVHLAIPANASDSRLELLHALGAEVTLTDPLEGSDGARVVAAEIASRSPETYYFADQYNNPLNWKSHYKTTGPELLSQTEGSMTHLVAGLGTSGTMMGTGRFLKEVIPDIHLVSVQPEGPLHGLEGLKHMASSPKPGIYDPELPDVQFGVSTEDAYAMSRELARVEGLLVGISAGAAVQAALSIGTQITRGVIVVILPDSASKYLELEYWKGER